MLKVLRRLLLVLTVALCRVPLLSGHWPCFFSLNEVDFSAEEVDDCEGGRRALAFETLSASTFTLALLFSLNEVDFVFNTTCTGTWASNHTSIEYRIKVRIAERRKAGIYHRL